jgi:hypothetical protein
MVPNEEKDSHFINSQCPIDLCFAGLPWVDSLLYLRGKPHIFCSVTSAIPNLLNNTSVNQ